VISLSAWWGLGYAALAIAVGAYSWYRICQRRSAGWAGDALTAIAGALVWAGLLRRGMQGHGWPFVSPSDRAVGIAAVMLINYVAWKWLSGADVGQFATASLALLLLSYGLAGMPDAPITSPMTSTPTWLGSGLKILSGGLLALAATVSLGSPGGTQSPRSRQLADSMSENLVRVALFCLAISLGIDTWWLQRVGLGSTGDAQQAGIAIAWMVYFVALRLRASARWRGWPWAAILAAGFVCILPILIQAGWINHTLPI